VHNTCTRIVLDALLLQADDGKNRTMIGTVLINFFLLGLSSSALAGKSNIFFLFFFLPTCAPTAAGTAAWSCAG
jgi:hypothetical protein